MCSSDLVEVLLLRIDTDEGISGWGEASANRLLQATKTAIDTLIAPMCIGRDATAITDIANHIERTLGGSGRSSVSRYAMSAIDIALWDILGKQLGQPIWRLLGAAEARPMRVYYSHWSQTLNDRTPAKIEALARQTRTEG